MTNETIDQALKITGIVSNVLSIVVSGAAIWHIRKYLGHIAKTGVENIKDRV